jgi:hypothetical protein
MRILLCVVAPRCVFLRNFHDEFSWVCAPETDSQKHRKFEVEPLSSATGSRDFLHLVQDDWWLFWGTAIRLKGFS